MPLDPALAAHDVCRLVTRGRVSGLPREIEIWFAADPDHDRVYLLSGGRDDAQWVRNIRADPRVRLRFGNRVFDGIAREIEGDPDESRARRLVAARYGYWRQGTELTGWARDSLPVAIDLVPPES